MRKLPGHRKTVKMTGTTSHRELESDAVFHISPTRFHFPAAAAASSAAAAVVALRLQAHLLFLVVVAWISLPRILKTNLLSHLVFLMCTALMQRKRKKQKSSHFPR